MTRQGGGYAYAAATGPRRTVELRAYAAIAPPPVSTGTATRTMTLHALAAIEAEGFGVEVTATTALAAQAAIAVVYATQSEVNISTNIPYDMCLIGTDLYVAAEQLLSKIDTTDMSLTAQLALPGCPNPTIATDGTYLYLASAWTGAAHRTAVTKVHPTAMSILAQDTSSSGIWGVTRMHVLAHVSFADIYVLGNIWTGVWKTAARKYSKATCAMLSEIILASFRTGPHGVDGATTDGTALYCSSRARTMIVKVTAPVLSEDASVMDATYLQVYGLTNDGSKGYAALGTRDGIAAFSLSDCSVTASATGIAGLGGARGIVHNSTSLYLPAHTIGPTRVTDVTAATLAYNNHVTPTYQTHHPIAHDGTYAYVTSYNSGDGNYYVEQHAI